MGMSTNLKADIELKSIEEIGLELHGLLVALFNHVPGFVIEDIPKKDLPDHPFWSTKRFYRLGGQGYTERWSEYDEEKGSYEYPLVKVRASVNYGTREIYHFLDWITPYVKAMPSPADFWDEHNDYDITYKFIWELDANGVGSFYRIREQLIPGGMAFGDYTETKKQPLAELIKNLL